MKIVFFFIVLLMTTSVFAHSRDPFFPDVLDVINHEKAPPTLIDEPLTKTQQTEQLHHRLYPLH